MRLSLVHSLLQYRYGMLKTPKIVQILHATPEQCVWQHRNFFGMHRHGRKIDVAHQHGRFTPNKARFLRFSSSQRVRIDRAQNHAQRARHAREMPLDRGLQQHTPSDEISRAPKKEHELNLRCTPRARAAAAETPIRMQMLDSASTRRARQRGQPRLRVDTHRVLVT